MTCLKIKSLSQLQGWACVTLALAPGASSLAASQAPYAERMHARAVESFRQGRFPEAFGRFIELANTGHPASARYALWMCEQGPALFGKEWDCAPHEMEDWSHAARADALRTAAPGGQSPSRPALQLRR